ncbi:MAG: ATPase, T2SS/T4P/T4SS family [Armatimonadota bacterium]
MKTQVGFPELLPALLIFTRQFATLVQHGVTIRQCFVLLAEDAPTPYAEITEQLGEHVEAGRTLYEAMSVSDYLFPPLYLAMIRAGEVGGVLDEFLGYLAELLAEEWEFRRQGALGEDDLMLFNPAAGPKEWHELSDERRLMTLSLWCRTMSMLLSARVPLDIALLTGAKILPPTQQQSLQQDAKHPELTHVLRSANFLPATALTLIGLGHQGGTLDLALDHLAALYRDMFRYLRVKPAKKPARETTVERVRRMIRTPQAKPDLDVILRAVGMPGAVGETITIDPQLGGVIPRHLQDRYHAAPLRLMGNRLVVAMVNPGDEAALDDFRLVTGYEIKPLQATDTEIEKIRALQQEPLTPDWSKLEQEVSSDSGAPPIIRLVNVLIENAIKQGATDILLLLDERKLTVRYRIEGKLHDVMTLPTFGHKPIVERLKIMAEIPLHAEPPQRGHIHIRHERRDYDAIVEVAAGEFGEVVTIGIAKQEANQEKA